jgi:hypothetical protein
MQHAIARQAEAERERRAKIINAEGEAQAATRLADAAEIIGRNPTTLQLRYLQTLREIGATQNTTVVFPMPIDLVKPVLQAIERAAGEVPAEAGGSGEPSAGQLAPLESAAANGALEAGPSRALGAGSEPGAGAGTSDADETVPRAEPAAKSVADAVSGAEPAADAVPSENRLP